MIHIYVVFNQNTFIIIITKSKTNEISLLDQSIILTLIINMKLINRIQIIEVLFLKIVKYEIFSVILSIFNLFLH